MGLIDVQAATLFGADTTISKKRRYQSSCLLVMTYTKPMFWEVAKRLTMFSLILLIQEDQNATVHMQTGKELFVSISSPLILLFTPKRRNAYTARQ